MKAIPQYGTRAFIVPFSVISELKSAAKAQTDVILYVLANDEFDPKAAASELGITLSEFKDALSYWADLGIIELSGAHARKTSSSDSSKKKNLDLPTKPVKKLQASTLPSYTTSEIAEFLEGNAATAEIIDSCENIIGKIFTTAETSIVIGLMDHLSLSGEYILLLFAHAARMDKKSVRYVEKLAISFVDRDITKYSELESELESIELTESAMRRVRNLFGVGNRSFTPKEKAMITDWCVTWSFSSEMIEKAYEITADSTGEASLKYANAVLENWFNEGVTTVEQVNARAEEFEKNRKPVQKSKAKQGGVSTPFKPSFDDDFFEAAVRRSYEDSTKDTK